MERDVDNFTLRIPVEINKSIKELSKEIDISQNSLILFFINIGIKSYQDCINHQKEEFRHFVAHNQK